MSWVFSIDTIFKEDLLRSGRLEDKKELIIDNQRYNFLYKIFFNYFLMLVISNNFYLYLGRKNSKS